MKKFFQSLALYAVAVILMRLLIVANFVYVHFKMLIWLFRFGYRKPMNYLAVWYHNSALSIDKAGNVFSRDLLNDWLVKDSNLHFKFGSQNTTVSRILAENKYKKWYETPYPYTGKQNNLTILGKGLAWILNKIDQGHLQKALPFPEDINK